ncbi:hypothetical protein DFH09DRAFT_1505386 [Mycena vulgaris]|nr:hypothetical protein DFH09DRAFT_1505386 [Mycena vulgaris]
MALGTPPLHPLCPSPPPTARARRQTTTSSPTRNPAQLVVDLGNAASVERGGGVSGEAGPTRPFLSLALLLSPSLVDCIPSEIAHPLPSPVSPCPSSHPARILLRPIALSRLPFSIHSALPLRPQLASSASPAHLERGLAFLPSTHVRACASALRAPIYPFAPLVVPSLPPSLIFDPFRPRALPARSDPNSQTLITPIRSRLRCDSPISAFAFRVIPPSSIPRTRPPSRLRHFPISLSSPHPPIPPYLAPATHTHPLSRPGASSHPLSFASPSSSPLSPPPFPYSPSPIPLPSSVYPWPSRIPSLPRAHGRIVPYVLFPFYYSFGVRPPLLSFSSNPSIHLFIHHSANNILAFIYPVAYPLRSLYASPSHASDPATIVVYRITSRYRMRCNRSMEIEMDQ